MHPLLDAKSVWLSLISIIGASFLLSSPPANAGITWPGIFDTPPVTEPQPGDTVTCTGICPGWADGVAEQTLLVTAGATIPQVDLSGPDSTIENHGTITGGASLLGPAGTFQNFGTVDSIFLGGTNYEAHNHGTIASAGSGSEFIPHGVMISLQQGTGNGLMVNGATGDGTGEITTTGDYSAGMLVRDPNAVIILRNNARVSAGGVLLAQAEITTTGTGSPGIHLVDDQDPGDQSGSLDNTIENNGLIETHGSDSAGIRHAPLWDGFPPGSGVTRIENLKHGRIVTNATDAPGILTHGHDVAASNLGSILTRHWDAIGIDLRGTYRVAVTNEFSGSITTRGSTFSPGIMVAGIRRGILDNILNEGSIVTEGTLSPGIVVLGSNHGIDSSCDDHVGCRSWIETSGEGSAGIQLGLVEPDLGFNNPSNNGTAANGGTISTSGPFAPGITVVGSNNVVTNHPGATINTSGDGSSGIQLSGSSTVENYAGISTDGSYSSGIHGDGAEIEVRDYAGDITTSGESAVGIDLIADVVRISSAESTEIITEGEGSHGIRASSSEVSLTNDGLIRTTGIDACGIHVSSLDGHVWNDGVLDTTGAGAVGIQAGSETAMIGEPLEIVNRGTIMTGEDNADGVHASTGFLSVSNQGSISTSGANSDGIEMGGKTTFSFPPRNLVRNDGQILVSGTGSVGVRLASESEQEADFVNGIDGSVTSAGVAVAGGDGIDEVSNWGSLTGDVQLGANRDAFTRFWGGEVTGTVDGGGQASELPGTGDLLQIVLNGPETLAGAQFINFELFAISGIGSLTLTGDLVVRESTFHEGEVYIAELVTLDSDLTVDPGATLGGAGSVGGDVIGNGGSVSPGQSTGTLSVEGNFTLDDGTLILEAHAAADHDVLSVRGDVSLAGGALHVFLGYVPGSGEVLQFFDVDGAFTMGPGFDGVLGFADPGSGVPVGTPFTIDLGGTLVAGVVSGFVGDPLADTDHDGVVALVEYAQGGRDDDGRLVEATTVSIAGDSAEFLVSRNPDAGDVRFIFEVSADLQAWTEAGFIAWVSPNRALYSFPADGCPQLFGRGRIDLR